MTENQEEIILSCSVLNQWINKNGFTGYDPYDIKASPRIIKLTEIGNRNKVLSFFREFIFELFYTFPFISRKLLQVKPTVNAKAMGLFASAYLDLYKSFQDKTYLDKAEECLLWLNLNKKEIGKGIGWGYPFDWQSKELIPAGTPNGIVTTAVGEAFWKHYIQSGDSESLDMCIKICEFLSCLPKDKYKEDQFCFSYTPIFINHVHNLNLFVAEFLIKVGQKTGNDSWVDSGNKAINYTLAGQLQNGSFDYNGPPEKPNHHFDNYHTSFVLRMLHSVWKLTDRQDVYESLSRCYKHYIANFFIDNSVPKYTPDRKYRIDIHSCAESINCLSQLSQTFPEGLPLAENILKWTILNLQDKSGYFYYGILKKSLYWFPI